MKLEPARTLRLSRWPLILLVLTFVISSQVGADGPMLAVRLHEGENAIYSLSEIDEAHFDEEGALVIMAQSGSDWYAIESIARIEFLFDFSGATDPRDASVLIDAVHLLQNRPNPILTGTRIAFDLPIAGTTVLSLYDSEGRLLRTLVSEEREAGRHVVTWDGQDEAGRPLPGGAYFYRLRAPGIEESRRMILLP